MAQRGFSLIELLVTIAIIGILSAVILASLNSAKEKGYDAAIISSLETIRVQAQLYYNGAGNNSYGAAYNNASIGCPTSGSTYMFYADEKILAAINAIKAASTGANPKVVCHASGGANPVAYAVQARLRNGIGGRQFWCVDSSGNSKPEASAYSAGATAVCP